jgi:hypothetical protein
MRPDPGMAAALNLLLPGAGYFYAHKPWSAVFAIGLWACLLTLGWSALTADGTLIVGHFSYATTQALFSFYEIRLENRKAEALAAKKAA